MHTQPTVEALVARAIAATPFVADVAAAPLPLHVRIAAELAAHLAVELWEHDARRALGMDAALPLIDEIAMVLVERAGELARGRECAA